ncbi:C4-dicarboxylate TRAP transporter substrate-binding protein [Roseisalinus antarcticus]|uniref:Bacterial extracellular solute-binding protein, family 7 n=1 Tax=Roseisalinus antarcticus TaxID=254357 RepID=A0A1Y5RQA1_9RHOB|nr:C4-dicarboxylate TRAP transporter substrate-binding protein [Roseisalinus antarcticus]SLN19931.1 Bacterial extracellular solute-binding protein, family 7 [Roseisalinus antarcticus]
MNMNRRQAVAGMISLTSPLVLGSRAFAQDTINLTISSSHPTAIAWVTPLHTVIVEKSNAMLEERGSNYRINWTEAYGGSLYDFNDTLEAVSQQLTDMGWIGSIWEPSTLPLQNIMYSVPFNTQTVDQAINTMNRLNDSEEAMKREWTSQDITFFGSCVSDGYHLFTKTPIEQLSDLEGMRLLGVPVCAPWVEAVGATLVNTGIPAMYGQLQTGVGEGTILIGTGAYPLKLHEQAPFVTRVNTGPLTFGGFGVNTDTFNSLPEDVQEVIAELGREYSIENARLIEEREALFFDKFVEEGATVTAMPDEQKLEWVNRMPPLGQLWADGLEERGIPGRDILVKYMATVQEEGGVPLRDWAADL